MTGFAPFGEESVLFELSFLAWLGLLVSALLIGMAKTGLHGVAMPTVPLLALMFGAKSSTGIALGMLVAADIMAVIYYHRHADWAVLWRVFPAAGVGVVVGTLLGDLISDSGFATAMVIFIVVSLVLMIGQELKRSLWIPRHPIFAVSAGILGGVTTMVGNMAGPVMTLYLLSQRLPKQAYIGTVAWFFLAVNLFKIPFHVVAWETITLETILVNVIMVPVIGCGAWVGIVLVKRLGDSNYRWFIIATTAMTALVMLARS